MRVLFIGGTGIISTACTQLAAQRGIDLTLATRGPARREPAGRRQDPDHRYGRRRRRGTNPGGTSFDVVVDWIAFTPAQIERDLKLFRGRTGQYIFISSASAYQKPSRHYLITESTPLANPYWQYARDKIACEDRLLRAYRDEEFPDHDRAPLAHLWRDPDHPGHQ